jgi:hypothetical protein
MNLRNLFLIFVSLAAGSAFGDDLITINFDFSAVDLTPGGMIDFTGTITNDTGEYAYLNALTVDGLPAGLNVDTSPFLNGPFDINPNQTSVDFTFFSVASPISYAGPFGMLSATVTILGDISSSPNGDFAQNPIGGATVTVDVPVDVPTPEPGTLLMLVAGLLLVCLPLAGKRAGALIGRPARCRENRKS